MRRTMMTWLAVAGCLLASAQTLNVNVGEVTYAVPAAQAGDMVYSDGSSLTILGKTFAISDISSIYVDDTEVTDNTVNVAYDGETAKVLVAGNVMKNLTVKANGGHVSVVQDADVSKEITYTLSGSTTNGSFFMDGKLKMTLVLNGVSITNPDSAAVNIRDGKRIAVTIADGTTNTLVDGTGGSQKACFAVKGHTEFTGGGTLNITGNTAHAFWGKEYVQLKKKTGVINILGAVGDGFNVNQFYQQNGGKVTISGIGDDGIQVSYAKDDDGNIEEDADNTGQVTIAGGSLDITLTGDGSKAIKAEGDVNISGGTITITQSGNIVVEDDDISYSTSIKAGGNINVTGGTITINNTAQGGKGLSADGDITIDESSASTTINITANGQGGTAETAGSGDSGPTASYKVYVSLPANGGGGGYGPGSNTGAWSTVYLYKSDGTLVQKLTSTVTKSSGYSSATFYYYDFGTATDETYYFQSDNYTGRMGTYAIKSATFSAPKSGDDVYYAISNSYTTSGSTRTYALSNVTSTYGGTSDTSEDEGKGYNAAGIKADGNVTISAGTITVGNTGAMSKSIKSKATVTIDGGDITLTPAGAMQVINQDASYSAGVKAVDFIQNGGTLKITATGSAARGVSADKITTNGGTLTIDNSGAGQTISSANYTAKGLKADSQIALNAGTITINMTGTGGKGIKSSGTYTQGLADGSGPTLTVNTTGSSLGGSSSGGGWGGFGGQSSGGSSAKAVKVMGAVTIYGGETTVTTKTDGAEGLESKTSIDIQGGRHYFQCYDDCINSSGCIYFNGGVTVCYSNGNDAVDSNAGRTGAITIGNGVVFAYTTKGSPEEGLDCDNNSYIQITGTGIAVSAGGSQGGGGGGWGGSSGGNTISNAKQGYAFVTNSISYAAGRYYTLADSNGNNLVTYSFPVSCSSTLGLFTATGMTSGSTYTLKYSTTAPTDATTDFHGIYLGSSAVGTTSVTSFTAQ
ncbi:MAG: carbohydrate-binding domain-containing protein [Prevotella sp.]|nr:carbohydrate-binding domain-containing protein [Prevotella sp.]